MIYVYQKGDLRRIGGTFTNAAGTPTDPTTITFKYTRPSGTTVTLVYGTDAALMRTSAGVYYVDLDITEAGKWYYRFAGTGTVQEAEDGQFNVEPSGF